MRDFFKPWRRKIGVVTLVMACVFMAGWMRSVVIYYLPQADTVHGRPSSNESISVPSFGIELTLTDAAKSKLESASESIIVAIYFDGDGVPLPGEKTDPFRDVYLGEHRFEIQSPGTFWITDAKISDAAFRRLTDRNYYYSTNVFSGRRVFSHNIINGGFVTGRVNDLSSTTPITVTCDLISDKPRPATTPPESR